MAFGAELGLGEPVCRKFRRAVRHVFPAEDAESEHLFRGQLRAEIGVKVPANRLSQEVFVALLHQIIDFDTHGFYLYRLFIRIIFLSWKVCITYDVSLYLFPDIEDIAVKLSICVV